MTTMEIMEKYTHGELTVDETNAELKKAGAGYRINPGKNILTEEEKQNGTAGLLDSGTVTLDKVKIDPEKMEIIGDGMGEAAALCFYMGKTYDVQDKKLIEK